MPTNQGTTGKLGGYILNLHSAVGIAASLRADVAEMEKTYTIRLVTAHPAKFAHAVDLALKGQSGYVFEDVLLEEFKELDELPRRVEAIGGEDQFGEVKKLIQTRIRGSGMD